jgi:hypothetical protein
MSSDLGNDHDFSNKEIIYKLKAFFLEQDFDDIAYALASTLIDLHRMVRVDELPEKEKISLSARLMMMDASLVDFVKNGPRGKFKITKPNSDEF